MLFIEEPAFLPANAPHLAITERQEGVTVIVPVLPEDLGIEHNAERIGGLVQDVVLTGPTRPRVLWYYTPMAIAFSRRLEASVVVYDNMDELCSFLRAPPRLFALEEELLVRADLVFTGGMSLYIAKRARHPSVHPFPSSVDAAHFGKARAAEAEPADQAIIPGPRVGFFGVIDERLDVELVRVAAELRPDWHFVMIGPVVKINPATLPKRPNIHWLGSKSYSDLPSYLADWDAGFMPFALNEATRFISPTKTPEFLAAGVPVVSTRITDVVTPYGERGLVEIADGPADLVAKLEAVIARPRECWLAKVDQHLATMSWDKTWAAMHALIEAAVESKTARAGEMPQAVPLPSAPFTAGAVNV